MMNVEKMKQRTNLLFKDLSNLFGPLRLVGDEASKSGRTQYDKWLFNEARLVQFIWQAERSLQSATCCVAHGARL